MEYSNRSLYYNARYYDPAIGRFISVDTVVPGAGPLTLSPHDVTAQGLWGKSGEGTGNPQELNRYSYVNNSPVNKTDPTGHCGTGDCIVIGAEIGTIIEPGGGTIIGGLIGAAFDLGAAIIGVIVVKEVVNTVSQIGEEAKPNSEQAKADQPAPPTKLREWAASKDYVQRPGTGTDAGGP